MTISRPTIFLVPGAWHPSSCYSTLLGYLADAEFPTLVASLPSLCETPTDDLTCSHDSSSVRSQLLTLIDGNGQDVIVVSHSYGGIPGGGAAAGLSKTERSREGKGGGVLGLVYICAFIVPEAKSLLEYMGGKHPPYVLLDQPSQGLCTVASPTELLFHDVDPTTANNLANIIRPHGLLALESPAAAPAWAEKAFHGRVGFLRCTEDRALPPFLQDMFVNRSGVEWTVKDIDAGHSPWASKPTDVVDALSIWANEWASEVEDS